MPEILGYDFMVRALVGAAVVGVLAPALGVFLVLRRLSLIADSLSHVALAGVAIGLITRAYPSLTALVATTTAAAAIEMARARRLLPGDVALAVVLYCALAVAVVIISLAQGFNVSLFGYLFGSVLTVARADLWLLGGLSVAVLAFVTFFYSELAQVSFDSNLARTSGVRVDAINVTLAVLTGATITFSMRVVGVLLVGALVVMPVMASLRLATGLRAALVLAVVFGVVSAIAGLTIAFYADVAPGGTVVLTAAGLLLAAIAWSTVRDRLVRRRWGATAPEATHAAAPARSDARPTEGSAE